MAPVTKKSKETEPSKAIKIPKKKVVGKDNPTIARSPQTSMTDFFGKFALQRLNLRRGEIFVNLLLEMGETSGYGSIDFWQNIAIELRNIAMTEWLW
ncbi:unnamed protein product [Anisakis simplex]|uniref:WIYLD domain-containing protein n=1 Tax=Anisakis simplex TaxID=6269 RepID=A0A0M3JLU8_ANISI|nr:unnamed protein product [Anisakis simplex]